MQTVALYTGRLTVKTGCRLGSRRLNDFPAGLWKLRLKSG